MNFTDILESKQWINFKGKLPFIVGLDKNEEIVLEDLAELNNLLIVGAFDTHLFLNSILLSICNKVSNDNLEIEIVDLKKYFSDKLLKIPHIAKPIIRNVSDGFLALNALINEIAERNLLYARNHEIPFHKLTKPIKDKLKKKIFIITGFETFDYIYHDKLLEDTVSHIHYDAKNVGISLIIECNSRKRDPIDCVKNYIKNRICFPTNNVKESICVLGSDVAHSLKRADEFIFSKTEDRTGSFGAFMYYAPSDKKPELKKFKSPSIHNGNIKEIICKMTKQKHLRI